LKFFDGFFSESAFAKIGEPDSFTLCGGQVFLKVSSGKVVNDSQTFFYQPLFFFCVALLRFLNFNMIPFCKPGYGFGVTQLLVLLYKGDHIAGFAAAETFVDSFGCRYRK